MRNFFLNISLLTLSLSMSSFALAAQFDNTFFFGDSLSDIGNQTPRSNGDNLWSKSLAAKYGIPLLDSNHGGTNYAIVGDQTGSDLPHSNQDGGMLGQVNGYILNNKVDPRGLYSLWAGANDFLQRNVLNSSFVDPAIIINDSVTNIIHSLSNLHNAGARYLMVLNLPDLGSTPAGHMVDPDTQAKFTKISVFFNAALLNNINNLGFNVIQLDIAGLLNEVIANPSEYGFTNVTKITSCYSENTCNYTGYLFYDYLHPTQAGHAIIADYAYAILQSSNYAAVLAEAPFTNMDEQNSAIETQLLTFRMGLSPLPIGHFSTFASTSYAPVKITSNANSATTFNNQAIDATAGVTYQLNPYALLGLAIGHSLGKVPTDNNHSGFDLSETVLSSFGSIQADHAYADGIISLGQINEANINRHFNLGISSQTASGDTTGTHYSANLLAGYNMLDGTFKTGPLVNLAYQHINVNAYTEEGAGPADVVFGDQKNDSLLMSGGWQAAYTAVLPSMQLTPFGQLTYNQQMLSNYDRDVQASTASLPGSHYGIPASYVGDPMAANAHGHSVAANVGMIATWSNHISLSVDYTNTWQRNVAFNMTTVGINLPL